MPFKSEKQRKWMHANNPEMAKKWEKKEKKMKREQRVRELIKKMVREEMANLDEAAKRDYKAEYKKFQSSTKSKKYRAELNAYNRKKGTYGNGDGKDASHKGGKIVGFEKESVNRGRREKSRLKKEGKLNERLHVVDERYVGKYIIWVLQDGNKIRTAVMGKKGFDNISSNDPDDLKKLWNLAKKFKGKPIPDIATEGKLTEGKWTLKGKYLAKDGGMTSIPGPYDNDAVVVGIKNDTFNLYKGSRGIYAAGSKYDKSFKNEKELVKWLNKEKAKYYGIDRR